MNEIIHGDCLGVMEQMQAESIDLIVTSPPYNINAENTGMGHGLLGHKKNAVYESHNDSMPEEDYISWQRNCLRSMMRVLKPAGAIFYNQKWRIANQLRLTSVDEIVKDMPIRQIIIWSKPGGVNHDDRWFLPTYEVIYFIAKPEFKLNPKANAVGDIWKFSTERANLGHPAPFPIDIPLRCIDATDAKIILDPFAGSGTTCLAAKMRERDYIGIDISEQYCTIARNRISQWRNQRLV